MARVKMIPLTREKAPANIPLPPGVQGISPEAMARMFQEGTSTAPVDSVMEGVARAAKGMMGGWMSRQAKEQEQERLRAAQEAQMADAQAIAQFLQGGQMGSDGMGPPTPAGGIESLGSVLPQLQSPEMRQNIATMLLQRAMKEPEQFTLAPGAVRYDSRGKPIASAPHKPDTLSPEAEAQKRRIAAAGRSSSTTKVVMPPLEEEESKAEGKRLVAFAENVINSAQDSQAELQNLIIAKQIPVTTGALEPLKAKTAALAQGFGIDPNSLGLENAANAQAFTGIMQNLVLAKLQAQKGPQTENDAKRIEATVANLGQTPEAANFLMDAAIAMNQQNVERAEFWTNWRAEKGTYQGARAAWDKITRKRPLVGINPNTNMPVFYYDFREKVAAANPGASEADILELWSEKYGQAR